MTPSPAVSVVMPVYNAGPYLREAVESVLGQSFGDLELLCCDDGSTDDSWAVLEGYAAEDPRLRPTRGAGNLGAAEARNVLIRAARGRYLAFLDADDWWMPDKLERQGAFMRDTGSVFSFTPYEVHNTDLDGAPARIVDAATPDRVDYEMLLRKEVTLGCSTVLIDRDRFSGMLMPSIRRGQDYAFWLSLLREHRCTADKLPAVLTRYRVRANSVSRNKLRKAAYQWYIYRRLEALPFGRSVALMSHYAKNAIFRK